MMDMKALGVIVAILGGLVAIICFLNGFVISPGTAPQQAVQELRFVEAAIGVLVFALGIVIFQLEDGRVARRRDRGFDERVFPSNLRLSGTTRSCPHCTASIRTEAKVCRFCGRDVEPLGSPEVTAPSEPTSQTYR